MPLPDIPAMPECTSCGECCGPVTATTKELRKLRRFVADFDVEWVEHPDAKRCGFWRTDGTCAVYQVRPFLCRIFGVHPALPCSYFPETATRMPNMTVWEAARAGWCDLGDQPIAKTFAPDGGERQRNATRQEITLVTGNPEASEILWDGKYRNEVLRGLRKKDQRRLEVE